MRQAIVRQGRLDGGGVVQVELNFNCRDELIPILRGLQHVYSTPTLRDEILKLVERDVSAKSRADRGRGGLSYWCILVLASARLGCHLDYDKLQDLAENHRALRSIMQVGDFDETNFSWKRIRDNVCLLQPPTIEEINRLIVRAGQGFAPEAVKTMRADSFVIETNIHYPTDSSLIVDGIRKVLELSEPLARLHGVSGWRQHEQLLRAVKKSARRVARIAHKKGPNYKEKLKTAYAKLLKKSGRVLTRVKELIAVVKGRGLPSRDAGPVVNESLVNSANIVSANIVNENIVNENIVSTNISSANISSANIVSSASLITDELLELTTLETFVARTQQVRDIARRRVILGETVPNDEKLFSLFEPHTQLYKRGKAGKPVQFGRLVLVFEDAAGFITQHRLLTRSEADRDVAVSETRRLQERYGQQVETLSFDRGFHSPSNQEELPKLVKFPCLPKPGVIQAAAQARTASDTFRQSQQHHPGIESAIGGLQSGNGLKRCRDRGELGLERYLALGILGRNLHTLGRLVIQRAAPNSEAAHTRRAA